MEHHRHHLRQSQKDRNFGKLNFQRKYWCYEQVMVLWTSLLIGDLKAMVQFPIPDFNITKDIRGYINMDRLQLSSYRISSRKGSFSFDRNMYKNV